VRGPGLVLIPAVLHTDVFHQMSLLVLVFCAKSTWFLPVMQKQAILAPTLPEHHSLVIRTEAKDSVGTMEGV
jgi:hypothetical protein